MRTNQLSLFGGKGKRTLDPGPCVTCGASGRWARAECGQCIKEAKQNERRRWYAHCKLTRSGAPRA